MKNKSNIIETFEELNEKILVRGDFLSTFFRGHLMIEFLFVKTLQIKPNKYSRKIKGMKHFELISAMHDLQYINKEEKKILLRINRMRNDLAHNALVYFPSVAEMRSLIENAQKVFIDFFEGFSNGSIKLDKLDKIENSEIEILIDFFMEILYNLKCNFDHFFEEYYLL